MTSHHPLSRFRSGLLQSPTALLTLLGVLGCGQQALTSGVAVGKMGNNLSSHAQDVPRGATVCMMKETMEAPPVPPDKAVSKECAEAGARDLLWQRAILALAAHADKMAALSSGAKPQTAGQLQAALTRVNGNAWVNVQGSSDQAARDAVTQLVTQVDTGSDRVDMDKLVKDAAPPVKTLCDGLGPYLDTQLEALVQIQRQLEKKRSAFAGRRCGMLDNRNVCVNESVLDRLGFASTFAQIAELETSHLEARDALNAFCAAHLKLEEAAQKGELDKDQTYLNVVEAVRSAPRANLPEAGKASSKSAAPAKD